LTAAHLLGQRRRKAVVFEADKTVGGIAKTVEFKDFRFDLGGHRFYTKLAPVQRLWDEALGDELLTRPRLSRIYYHGKFFNYPLTAEDVFRRLGIVEAARCALSYVHARWKYRRLRPETFEEWVVKRFGHRLYDAFFRSYTEKVWGIPGSEIRSEWAAQRIKNFSLMQALLTMLRLRREHSTTLIDEFQYPRLGPGQMWDEFRRRSEANGIPVRLNHRCVTLHREEAHVTSIVVRSNGQVTEHPVEGVLSSIPLSELILSLDPPVPVEVAAAARRLRYRNFCLVALMTSQEEPFPDNWIYLHDPDVRAGRVQNFGAWSPGMVAPGTTCLGAEYFCFEGDEIWEMPEAVAVSMATRELAAVGLLDPSKVFDGVKVRVPKAYPMYDTDYQEAVAVIHGYLESFVNLKTFGRNGLHRYNNQDHSMWTAILATLNLIDGTSHDVWSASAEEEYLEEGEVVEGLLELQPTH
jgi:protoporphyrinogen oxidase